MPTEARQVNIEPISGKLNNASIVSKLNELISHIEQNTNIVNALNTTVTELRQSLEFSQAEFETLKGTLGETNKKVASLEKDVTGLTGRCDQLINMNDRLQDQLTNVEYQSRRNNLVLDNIPGDSENETSDDCRRKVLDILDKKMLVKDVRKFHFVRIHRRGTYSSSAKKPRPMIFKLHYYCDRQAIWDKRRNLKDEPYWINEDFPEQILKKRRILNPVAKAARGQGKKAFLSKDKVIIDDHVYTTKNLHTLPRDLQPATIAQRVDADNKYTAFFRSANPLSNFHDAEFRDENGLFMHSSEQKYNYDKAMEFDDTACAQQILVAETPYQCYRLGRNIMGFNEDHWNRVAKEKMLNACKAKFSQNPVLMSYLKDTAGTKLVEANPYDKVWSCGLSMTDDNLFDEDAWDGTNWLGEVLEMIRDS